MLPDSQVPERVAVGLVFPDPLRGRQALHLGLDLGPSRLGVVAVRDIPAIRLQERRSRRRRLVTGSVRIE